MDTSQDSDIQPKYEDFRPVLETKDTSESVVLRVPLPDFPREHIRATFEADPRTVRILGERPLENNHLKRFNLEYQVPENCDVERIEGKFDGGVVTITIPKKKIISRVSPKEEPKPAQEAAAAKPTTHGAEEEKAIAAKGHPEGISQEPKSTTESQTQADEKKVETLASPEAKGESIVPQKDKEEIPQKDTTIDSQKQATDEKKEKTLASPEGIPQKVTTIESKEQTDEKKVETLASPKATGESEMPQKDQEGISQKGTTTESQRQDDKKEVETLASPKATGESEMPQKDQEGISQKGTATESQRQDDKKEVETLASLEATGESKSPQEGDGSTAEKKETEEGNGETCEAGKLLPQKDDSFAEEESNESSTVDESAVPKTIEEGKKMMTMESIGKGIKEVAASASGAVTKLAKRFELEGDKQKLLYVGAGVLVAALGIYASYKLRSRARS